MVSGNLRLPPLFGRASLVSYSFQRMKITIKTLQQKLFTVDVEPSETILAVKAKISELESQPVEAMKIIYAGAQLRIIFVIQL